MKVKFMFYVIFLVVLISSCSVKTLQLVKTQELIFETGFPIRDPYGIYYNPENSTEYFYIAELMEFRKIMFFKLNGEKAFEIPADSIANWRSTSGIAIKNLDTIIFVMSSHTGVGDDRIVFMDRTGKRWKSINLMTAIEPDENNVKYEFYANPVANNIFFDGNDLFLHSSFVTKTLDSTILKSRNKQLIFKESVLLERETNSLLKYNIFTNKYQFGLSNMFKTTICSDTTYPFFMHFAVENNLLIVYSATGNILYVLDKETFEIKKQITIESPHTKLNIPCATLEERINNYYHKLLNSEYGCFSKVLYDNHNKLYYVTFRHAPISSTLKDEAPFSIQILNEDFKKLTEQVFDGKKYNIRTCLVSSKGALIGHHSSPTDYIEAKLKYDLFELKKKRSVKTKIEKTTLYDSSLPDYERLDNYLHALSDTLSVENYDAIIFISDKEGICPSCLYSFSEAVIQYMLNQERILIILNAKGKQINITPFLSDTVKNVVPDYTNDFYRLNITSSISSVVELREGKINKIQAVELETLADALTLLMRIRYKNKKTEDKE